MIKFVSIEPGFAVIRWENLDDGVELKKFLDNCNITLYYIDASNPFNIDIDGEE